jgi:hydrogenase expression/formation protein HypE
VNRPCRYLRRQRAYGLLGRSAFVANEGILIALVEATVAEAVVSAMRRHEHGRHAAIIGEATDAPAGMVLLETAIGGNRIMDMLQGEQLPRIC